jgi:hypothetical protein
MTAREEWEALDAPEPTSTPTSLQSEWDSFDAPEPAPTSTTDARTEWDSFDAAPQPQPSFRPTSSFTNVESGGSAYTPNATPVPRETPAAPIATSVPEDFYSSMKARQKEPQDLWSVVKREAFKDPKMELIKENPALAAGRLTGTAPMLAQAGISVGAGALGRYAKGDDPFRWGSMIPFKGEPGIWQDLEMPILPNVALGAAKGLAAPLLRKTAPDLAVAVNDITQGWEELPKVDPSDVSARPLLDKNQAQAAIDATKDILGSPVQRGLESKIAELRDTAKRIDLFPNARNRLATFVAKSEQDIFNPLAEGVRGKVLRQRVEMPLADRENVKLFQQGLKTAEEVGPQVVEAAGKASKFYNDLGDLAERWGLFENAPRIKGFSGANIFRPGADVSSLAEETGIARTGRRAMGFKERELPFDPTVHVTDARELMRQYGRSAPEKLAGAYVGGPVGASTSEGTQEFGRTFNELLNRAGAQALDAPERARMESLIGSLKQIYHAGERSPGAALAGKAVGTTLLPLSWWNQFNQEAWNIAKPGLQNSVEGLVRYARDPEFRALIQASGGRGSSMEHLFNAVKGETGFGEDVLQLAKDRLPASISGRLERAAGMVGESPIGRGASRLHSLLPENMVGKGIGWSESMLRGPLGAGHYVHAEGLIGRALDEAATTGRLSRGLSRELREAGIDESKLLSPPAAADTTRYTWMPYREGLTRRDFREAAGWEPAERVPSPYARSAHTLRDTGARLTGRYQLMAGDPGHSSARIIGNPWGRVAAQFKSFPLSAARLFKNDVLDPLYQGVRHGDMSELSLGAGRLARLAPAAAVSTGVAMTGKQILQGKGPADWAYDDLPAQAARDVIGMPADIATKLYSGTDPTTGEWSPSRGAWEAGKTLLPPVVSLMSRPSWGRLGLLGANAMMPKLGSMATMLSPPFLKAGEPDEDPVTKLRREIDQLKNRARQDIERVKQQIPHGR